MVRLTVFVVAFLVCTGPYAAGASRLRQRAAAAPAGGAEGGVSTTSSKRIGAVIDTLKDLLVSIETEETADGKNFKCAMDWCTQEISSKKAEIDAAEVSLEDKKVAVRQHQAKQTTLQYVLDKNDEDMSELNDGMAQATGIRDEDKAKYDQDRALNMQSVGQITQAINIVGKVHETGGFLQNGAVQKMQLNEPGESSFVLGMFKSLKTGLERSQAKADASETKKQAVYDTLITTKSTQLGATQEESRTKEIALTETGTKLTETNNDISELSDKLAATRKYLAETEASCADKKQEMQVRTEDRAKEKAAIREAISFLEITFKEKEQQEVKAAFLQQQRQQVVDEALDGDDADGAPSFVQVSSMSVARVLIGTANAELATLSAHIGSSGSASQDVFDKVKLVVAQLIGVLQEQQKAETEKKEWCENEIRKKEGEKEETQDALTSLNSVIDRKSSEVATMVQEVKDINTAISDSKKRDEDAAKVRKEAKAIFDAGSKDRKLALKVLREARTVLLKFYETQDKTKLLQTGHKQMPETFSGSSRHEGEGNVVIAMIDKITADVEREEKDAAKEEQSAADEFDVQVKESRKEFDARMEEITMRVTRKAKVLVQLDNHKETQQQKTNTMSSVTEQLSGLASDCNELIKNHDEREKARSFEIAQLRDVTDILSGSQIAARTGLVQTAQAPQGLNNHDLAAFQDMSQAIDSLEGRARSLVN